MIHCELCCDFDGTEAPSTHRLIVRPGYYGHGEDPIAICGDCIEAASSEKNLIVTIAEYGLISEALLLGVE